MDFLIHQTLETVIFPQVWQYLAYWDIIAFARCSRSCLNIITKREVWEYLTERDFEHDYFGHIIYHPQELEEPRQYYEIWMLFDICGVLYSYDTEKYGYDYRDSNKYDKIVRHKLQNAVDTLEKTPNTYWISVRDTLVAKITANNRYDLILKYICNIDYPASEKSLTYYCADHISYSVERGKIRSYLDVLDKLRELNGFREQIVTELPHY